MGRCVAFGCSEIGNYKFPSDLLMKKKWEKALRIKNLKATQYSRLCRKHFKDTDFENTSKETGFPLTRKFLKKTAVPSWHTAPEKDTSARATRLKQRKARLCLISPSMTSSSVEDNATIPAINNHSTPDLDFNHEIDLGFIHEIEVTNTNEEDHSGSSSLVHGQCVSQSTQTSPILSIFTSNDLLEDNESVQYYTGLETFKKFRFVLSTLCPMAYNLNNKGSQVINLGIEEQFLIMLMKLRRNTNDFELSKFFGISKAEVSNIFVTWINFTYDLWSLIDIWPKKELVDCFTPPQFKKHHPSIRIIIDVTEIPISKPKNPIAQQATFSSYKNKNIMKFLVGSTPGGLLSYCSEGYGGATSDRQIIEQSDLLEKCNAGDSILAVRDFNVQDLFAAKNIALNIPAFLKGKSHLPGVTVKHDRELAKQIVHLEHLIKLSKIFTILKSDLKASYVPLASKIFFVCIMLCNFREGIINKHK